MKQYVTPTVEIEKILSQPLMDTSPVTDAHIHYGGDNSSEDNPVADTHRHRGEWGNLWSNID